MFWYLSGIGDSSCGVGMEWNGIRISQVEKHEICMSAPTSRNAPAYAGFCSRPYPARAVMYVLENFACRQKEKGRIKRAREREETTMNRRASRRNKNSA